MGELEKLDISSYLEIVNDPEIMEKINKALKIPGLEKIKGLPGFAKIFGLLVNGIVIDEESKNLYESIDFIDGVIVLYYDFEHNGQFLAEMYDADGKRLRTNCSKEDAESKIEELAEQGIEAVIGPKAPMCGADGRMIPNTTECVGIYIVSPEKKFSRKK